MMSKMSEFRSFQVHLYVAEFSFTNERYENVFIDGISIIIATMIPFQQVQMLEKHQYPRRHEHLIKSNSVRALPKLS